MHVEMFELVLALCDLYVAYFLLIWNHELAC
jgi:hypothetical protein